ncbi:DUF3482 domain-containing protein [Marinomonas sp. THO17]|uniref:DUF3482 domain-containing protein n=1 Tax=Marinomonas sp. THO17 TaxID=3149048 RepID=UPI00336C1F0B
MSIKLLVVGHANTGKTSLIRTLLRRHDFGEVKDQAGTTRHVETVTIRLADQDILQVTDTPGFEDSIGLWQLRQQAPFQSFSGSDWLAHFCQSDYAKTEFEQETKILTQLLQTDIILYVIDVRQAPLGKFLNELDILASANKPIVPILNFSASPTPHIDNWRRVLAERHLHTLVKYDSVAFYFEDEKRLYQSIQSLMPEDYEQLEDFIQHRYQDAQLRLQSATRQLAELLINAASYRLLVNQYPPNAQQQDAFEQVIHQQEQGFIQSLLGLYEFRSDDVHLEHLAIQNTVWQQDLFAKSTLKEWGLETSSGVVTGAAIGAGIDVMSAGLSLGTATGIGALLGAGWQTGKHYKDTIKSKLTKRHYLCLDDVTLGLLALRGIQAVVQLHKRGHAAQQSVQVKGDKTSNMETIKPLLSYFQQARQHPQWYLSDNPLQATLESKLQQTIIHKITP